jgi:hypothetical protein
VVVSHVQVNSGAFSALRVAVSRCGRTWDRGVHGVGLSGSIAKTAFETNTMFYDFHQVPYLKAFHNVMPS